MHTVCVGSLHTLLPSACHVHPLQGMGVSPLLFPLGVQGERKGAAILQCQLGLILVHSSVLKCPENREFFHKSNFADNLERVQPGKD